MGSHDILTLSQSASLNSKCHCTYTVRAQQYVAIEKAFVLPQSQSEVKMRSHNTQRKCTVMTQKCYKE